MPDLILTQDVVTGGDDDGSRDGRFMTDVFPVSCYPSPEYWTVADCRVGHIQLSGSCDANYCHWLRFRLPLDNDPNIDITDARLRLYWNPNLNVPVDDLNRPANINRSVGSLTIKYGIFPADDAPIPTDAADARSKLAAISTANFVNWTDGIETGDQRYVDPILSDPFCFVDLDLLLEAATIRRAGWANNNHFLLIFTSSVSLSTGASRYLQWRSWSWLKWQIATGELDASEIDTAPAVLLTYVVSTPGSGLGKHVEHELDFEQSISVERISTIEVIQDLEFIQEITVIRESHREIVDELEFEQLVKAAGPEHASLIQDINLTQWFTVELDRSNVFQELDIVQTIGLTKILHRSVEHTLVFEQDLRTNIFERTVEHILNFEQTIEVITPSAFSRHVEHELSFEQEVSHPGSARTIGVEHVLNFTQVFTGYIEGSHTSANCSRRDLLYSGVFPLPLAPIVIPQGDLRIDYPLSSPTHSVTLPKPLLSNREELQKTRIQRKTRAGDLKTFVDPSWPETETFRFKFQDLTDTQKVDLFTLVGASLAKEVKLTDHEGRVWNGVISNPNGEYTQVFRDCGHTAEFDFQVTDSIGELRLEGSGRFQFEDGSFLLR